MENTQPPAIAPDPDEPISIDEIALQLENVAAVERLDNVLSNLDKELKLPVTICSTPSSIFTTDSDVDHSNHRSCAVRRSVGPLRHRGFRRCSNPLHDLHLARCAMAQRSLSAAGSRPLAYDNE